MIGVTGGSAPVVWEDKMGLYIAVVAIFGLIQLVCSIIILIHAFKSSVGEGFLCLCVPCYILYYMFSKFEHPQKGLIVGLWFVGWIGGMVGNFALRPSTPSYGSYGY